MGADTDSEQLPLLGHTACQAALGGEVAPGCPLPAEASELERLELCWCVQLPGESLLSLCTLLSDHGDPRDRQEPSSAGDCGQEAELTLLRRVGTYPQWSDPCSSFGSDVLMQWAPQDPTERG